MPWEAFVEWKAYDLVDPFGSVRGDWQAANVAAAIVNSIGAMFRVRRRAKVSDFLLKFTDEPEGDDVEQPRQKTWQQMKMIARMCVADAKARLARKKR